MSLAALLTYNIATGIATLVLASIGLGVIYGMMRVINLAHGEFIMLGAMTCQLAHDAGVNMWIAMLVLPPIVVGAIGIALERLIIRHLYGRMIDTMLATWGISIALIGLVRTIVGSNVRTLADPVGSFTIGSYSASLYGAVIIVVALAVLGGLFALLRFTKFGLLMRATMEKPYMAAALGVSPAAIYMATFGIGAALAGLAGGVLAPISGISATMGAAYVTHAFITVLGGGAAFITGTALAATLFGTIDQIVSFRTSPVMGSVALLLAAMVLIRILPAGITGRFFRSMR
jgi:branched-chain amino acid transport system permease protein